LDSLARARKKNLEGQFDLFGMDQEQAEPTRLLLREIPEFTPQELMAMEKEVTGLYLSGHPMDAYRKAVRQAGAYPIGSLLADFAREDGPVTYQDNQPAVLAGIIANVKTKTTRNDSLMAYITLEDDTGSMELLAFSRVLEEGGSYIKANQPVLVRGRISVREDKPPQLMCDGILPLEHLAPESSAPSEGAEPLSYSGKLYVKLPAETHPLFSRVSKLFIMFPGDSPVILYCADNGRRFGKTCVIHDALLTELRALLGNENVVVKG
ncbi:MAG: polymerase alpha subunit, partial [Firmicutes bacterium]|nr:polymerase alpha subunit [Bacillota bacterium]